MGQEGRMVKEIKSRDYAPIFGNMKGFRIIIVILLAFTLLSFLITPSSFESMWPYFFLLLFLLGMGKIKDKKFLILFMITGIIVLLSLTFWFYNIIPSHQNYSPITIPGMQMIFQMFGKFQIFYSPDYPVQGDTILAFISLCNTGLTNCTDIENYTVSAYFIDEDKNQHILYNNVTLESKSELRLDYTGNPIFVVMNYLGKDYEFVIPKQSLWQTIKLQITRHPRWGLISLVAAVLTIFTFLIGIYKIVRRWRSKDKMKMNEDKLDPNIPTGTDSWERVLEELFRYMPHKYGYGKTGMTDGHPLAQKLKTKAFELESILLFLSDSKFIRISKSGQFDITREGIKVAIENRRFKSQQKLNWAAVMATLIIALATFVTLIIFFIDKIEILFSSSAGIIVALSILVLIGVMGYLSLRIFNTIRHNNI